MCLCHLFTGRSRFTIAATSRPQHYQVTLTSTETNFILKDNLDDVWGEVSAGVNFFNPSANTSVFPKVDVTSGDDVDGVGGKAGMGSLVGDLARNSGFAGPSNPA